MIEKNTKSIESKEEDMKKSVSIAIAAVLMLGCVLALTACVNSDFVGVYEMQDISGTVVSNGQTTTLDKSLYNFYTIELKADKTAVVKAQGAGAVGQSVETQATWTSEGNTIKLVSTVNGMSVVEEMTYADGILTFVSKQSAQGMTVEMTMTLKKQ